MRFADVSVLDKIPGVPVQLFSEDMLPVCRSSFSISHQIKNNFEEGKIKENICTIIKCCFISIHFTLKVVKS